MNSYVIERLDGAAARSAVPELAEVLVDCVEGGASVGFMLPMARATAEAFFTGVASAVDNGETILLAARDAAGIVGTVQLKKALMENQPHRADVSKLLVHRRGRRQGIGETLMTELERIAAAIGRRVLVLDTATPEAERLYERMAWQRCGIVPDYALMPDGRLCATTFYYKRLAG